MTTHPSPARTPSPRAPSEDPHRSLHSETGARPGEHRGRSGNPLVKVAGLAWLEFEKPDLDRAEQFGTDFGFTVADRTPDALVLRGRQAGCGVPGGPPRPASPVRRACLRRGRPRRPGPAGPRHGRDGHRALGRPHRPAPGPQRVPGARGARRPGPARAARARPAAAELRLGAGARQRHPAAGPAAGGDPAAGPRGAGHHPVPRRPGLVPGHARADRVRLPVPGRAARPRPGDGVHPLRPGQRPGRPSHPGDGADAADRLRALGLRGHRPGRGRRQRGVPARAGVPARVGPGPGTSRAARSSTTGATRTS